MNKSMNLLFVSLPDKKSVFFLEFRVEGGLNRASMYIIRYFFSVFLMKLVS